jgi:hypothetical protein
MRKDVPNVNAPPIVMDRGDDAKFVSADVEDRVGRNIIRRCKGTFEGIEIRKRGSLHHPEPSRERGQNG